MRRRWLLPMVAVAAGVIAWAALPGATAPGRAVGAEPPDRRIAITYDDLPANLFRPTDDLYAQVTEDLLAGLARHAIPAIGFVNENKLYVDGEARPERVALLQRWIDAGLELGNHTFSHPDLHTTDLAAFEEDVLRGERVTRRLLEAAGREPRWFRHPFLHTGRSIEIRSGLESFLADHGYRVAPVTIDNQEWIYARAYDHALVRADASLADRIAAAFIAYMDSVVGYYEAQSRALVGREIPQVLLLHANRLNAATTDRLVAVLRDRGYVFVPLEDALEDPAYGLPDTFTGAAGITWLHRWALTRGERGGFFAGEPEAEPFVLEVFNDPPP